MTDGEILRMSTSGEKQNFVSYDAFLLYHSLEYLNELPKFSSCFECCMNGKINNLFI
jgi:hypothetical protein